MASQFSRLAPTTVKVIAFPGLVPYETTWRYMRALCEYKNDCRKAGKENVDYLLLLQHKSVYTLGRGGSVEYLKFPMSAQNTSTKDDHDVFRVERGGEVTWHGPGQLVAYPILDLNHYKKDLHW
jgi:lipoyl(octanoyl) transferase